MKRVEGSEVGICPECGSIEVDYQQMGIEDGSVYYPALCVSCGLEFKEYYELKFDANYIKEEDV